MAKTKKIKQKKGSNTKNWLAALLLAIFLGQFGIDRFYLGYTGTGILKLLITIASVGTLGWVWWLVDVILIATKYKFARFSWD